MQKFIARSTFIYNGGLGPVSLSIRIVGQVNEFRLHDFGGMKTIRELCRPKRFFASSLFYLGSCGPCPHARLWL